MSLDQLRVLVPGVGRLPHPVGADHRQLDEAHPPLHEPARHQALPPIGGGRGVGRVHGVQPPGRLGFLRQVDQLRHRRLHPVGDLVVVDRRLHLSVATNQVDEPGVQVANQGETIPLAGIGLPWPDVVQRLRILRIDERALVDRRQEAVAEHVHPAQRDAAAAEHHEPGQVLVLGAQPVGHPGAHAREAVERHAGVEVEVRLRMLHERRRHRANDRELVGDGPDVRKQRADRNAALPVTRELPRARQDVAILVEHRPLGLERHRFARLGRQPRLRVERVDVREAAGHVAEDDILHLRREVGRFRGERPVRWVLRQPAVGPVRHQRRQGEEAETGRRAPQHLAPGLERTRSRMVVVTPRVEAHRRSYLMNRYSLRLKRLCATSCQTCGS